MAIDDLAFEDLLLKYGLVQFGRFANENGDFVPFKLNLDWMPSYPDLLKAAAFEVEEYFRIDSDLIHQFERILCPFDALPIATLVSTTTGIPLVYSRGRGEPAVRDLVGAYDINHPTLLIANTDCSKVALGELSEKAGRVGLKVAYSLTLVETFEVCEDGVSDFWVDASVISTISLVDMALAVGIVTAQFHKSVKAWISNH